MKLKLVDWKDGNLDRGGKQISFNSLDRFAGLSGSERRKVCEEAVTRGGVWCRESVAGAGAGG